MNWYSKTVNAASPIGSFNKTLLQTIGVGGAIIALMVYFNVDRQHAERMVASQPQEVEQYLTKIPKQDLLKLTDKSTPPVQPEPALPQKQEPPQMHVSGVISLEEMKSQIIQHEGYEHMAYPDTKGNMTVGIGFNLERSDARQILHSIGADYKSVYNRKTALNDEQINRLFEITFNEAVSIARNNVPDLDSRPVLVQKVVIDMAFNLGPNLSSFKRFLKDINSGNYAVAAQEMVNSHWYGQVKQRSRDLVRMMNEAANLQQKRP